MRLVALLVVALCVCASLAPADARTLFTRRKAPKGWLLSNRANHAFPIKFIVALNQQNLDTLESEFWAISDPKSPRYQDFKSIDEILSIVAPPQKEHDAVYNWLAESGCTGMTSYGDAIEATATVALAEKLFSTEFRVFVREDGKKIVRQWGSYSVPSRVSHSMYMVSGLSEFPVPHYRAQKVNPVKGPNGDLAVVPQTVEEIYGTPTTTSISNSSQGVIEFEDQYYANADLQSFAQQVDIKITNPSANHIVGYNDQTAPQDEGELDIQYVAAVGLNVDNWFWIEADPTWLYGFATHFFSTPQVPLVISISYGWSEADQCEDGIGSTECQQLGVDSTGFVTRVNVEFQKIGLRGISIMVASGDSGANGRTDGDCSLPYLKPDYPAASPFVTSVGATEIHNAVFNLPNNPPVCTSGAYSCASGGTEQAVSYAQSFFASGGGFSNVGVRPSYQSEAVKTYLNSGVTLPPDSYYNKTLGRGYPDIAAFGSAVLIYDGGMTPVGGTSCSSPILGGMFAVLNNYMIRKTGKPLGFLNPLLYQMYHDAPKTFTDVTTGDNLCTEDGCSSSCQGFYCAKGWDPVTGLGTPVYPQILSYLESHIPARS